MPVDLETYREKAQEAIEEVFVGEYHNSLGIPMPKVEMLLADDENYNTGEYYISIDETWQIHLNFGLLPTSFKEFQDEVKVLTRHEIEHYMCCPFDVITHLRMLKRICDTYQKEFSNLGIAISKACASISNQAADIIVDSKNFFRHPEDTIKSEIEWIKKGGDLQECPRHAKLMFLTKEAIWKRDLEINETDQELLSKVNDLAAVFLENGIEDKGSFLKKVDEYSRTIFKLYAIDQEEQESGGNDEQKDSGNGQVSPSNQSATGFSGKPKDGDSNGSAFVFADPDKVKEAIEAFAHETTIEEFNQILSIAGIGGLSTRDKERLWFSVNGASTIPIEEYSNKGGKDTFSYPSSWRLGDPIEDMDMMLTLMNSPIIIPGVTTKKWEADTTDSLGVEKKQRDLLLVVDTSGSMGSVMDSHSNMHQAVLAAFGIIAYFEQIEGSVALLCFNDRIVADVGWTKEYNQIRDCILMNGNGNTVFPIRRIQNIIEGSKNEMVTILISDGELHNISESVGYFRNYLSEDNRLYVFIVGVGKTLSYFMPLKNIGAHVFQSKNAHQFSNAVISDIM